MVLYGSDFFVMAITIWLHSPTDYVNGLCTFGANYIYKSDPLDKIKLQRSVVN